MNKPQIYILCPAYIVTGGIELLHQLCYKLCLLGFDAYMRYIGVEEGRSPIADVYKKYNVRMADALIDHEDNVFVFPEIYVSSSIVPMKAKRVLWWMSVDNAQVVNPGDFQIAFNDKELIHLSQSEYSTKYLIENGVSESQIMWLSDYINSEYLHLKEVCDEERDDVILFNPRKGFDKTASIIGVSSGHVKWIALSELYPDKMRYIMQHSKVYIDFGNHPGRDRIPREASMCGCLVITNKKGSANNDVDILIDNKYKFDNDIEPKKIYNVIFDLVKNYSSNKQSFEEYRNRTANEFKSIEVDILNAFQKITNCEKQVFDQATLKGKILDSIYSGKYADAFKYIVCYRQANYEEDIEFTILETTVRAELAELFEAEYEIIQCLKENQNNYELELILANVHSKMNDKDSLLSCLKECQNAINHSQGTEDANTVFLEAKNIIDSVKEKLELLKQIH